MGPSGLEKRVDSGRPEKVAEVSNAVRVFEELHRKAVVGRTVDLDTLIYFDRLLRIGKVKYEKIQYLGGLSILLSFGAETFLNNKELWGPWFSKLDMWEGQVLAVESIAWIRVHVFPLHLFDSEILQKIGNVFGKTLYVPKDVGEDLDLTVKCVGILAGHDHRIKEFVSLKWKDKMFRLWVSKEENEWVPNCLGSPESEKEESVKASSGRGDESMENEGGDVSVSNKVGGKKQKGTFLGMGNLH
ncbi:hypothetical protein HanPSC8_Chr10g0437161 [Helianthus annuus]|nr:hypothetical protein HanHA89_Chr10g0394481 [Helianthus annuus]KAJ0884725.1 hypothetical protein HanPSC8_Chr10g0437161 [Helianthus annuus]